jgi:hypothetical protein
MYLPYVLSSNIADPPIQPDGTYDYTMQVTLNNEGTTDAQEVNYNLGLGHLIDAGISFSTLEVSQLSGPSMTLNNAYDGNTQPLLLSSGNVLPSGETAVFAIHFVTNQIPSSDAVYYFYSPTVSMTQGPADNANGYDESDPDNRRVLSYVLWSDGLGDHIDRYYIAQTLEDIPSSNFQCHCSNSGIRFLYDFNFEINKTAEVTDVAPAGVVENEEVLFTLTITNHSPNLQIINLQIQDNLLQVCN